MRANELCERTAERLAELRVGSFIPSDTRNCLWVRAGSPCLVVCRARLSRQARRYMRLSVPVLLVRSEAQAEQVAQLLSFASRERVCLDLSSLAMWRAVA